MKTWAWGAAAASALAVGLAACGSGGGGNTGGTGAATSTHTSSGTGTSTGGATGTGGGPGCGATVFSPMVQCQACVQASCCSELETCDTGTPCAALLDCLTANKCSAGDAACITSCEDANSDGVTPAQALETCYDTSCSTQTVCQTGAICQSGLMVPNVQCGMCLGSNCCSQWTACAADAACSACATSEGMNDGCDTNALYTSATGCETSQCSSDCTQICDTGLTTNNPECDLCLGSNCCNVLDACLNDSTCDTCLLSASPSSSCSLDMPFIAATMCQSDNCTTQCMTGG